jgi:hypothetical protein
VEIKFKINSCISGIFCGLDFENKIFQKAIHSIAIQLDQE